MEDLEQNTIKVKKVVNLTSVSIGNSFVILGISPFSSNFTYENISRIVQWAITNSEDFRIFIPDLPTVYSLMSLGYEKNKAEKKAQKQCRYLKNKCVKALQSVNRHSSHSDIIDYDFLNKNQYFTDRLNQLISLYSKDDKFRSACDEFSASFLGSKDILPSREAIRYSSMYLIHELPIFINANLIFNKSSSFFMYPKCPSFVKSILKGELKITGEVEQDFLEYNIWR